MNSSLNLLLRVFPVLFVFLGPLFAGAQTSFDSESRSMKMYGEVGLFTNYVEKGITQSKKGTAINIGLGYLPGSNGRIGFTATTVSYANESANLRGSLTGEYKFLFASKQSLKVRNDFFQYFGETQRNKVTVSLDYDFDGQHILYAYEDNFEGTKAVRNWYGWNRSFPYTQTWQIPVTVGYSTVSGFTNFFDTKVGIAFSNPTVSLGLFNTYVQDAGQFGGSADMAFFLELQAKF